MRLVTYNIQYSLGKDGRYDLGRIAETIEGADIIALQEVERNWRRTGMADQATELAKQFPEHYWVFGPRVDMDASEKAADGRVVNRRKQFGNVLLSRWPILSSRNFVLPKFATLDRYNFEGSALEAVIDVEGDALRVYSIHLGHMIGAERLKQIELLLDIHRRAPQEGGAWTGPDASDLEHWECEGGPPPMPEEAIFLGDFNLEPGSAEYEALVGPWEPDYGRIHVRHRLIDAWAATGHEETSGVTFPEKASDGWKRPVRIDYCFVTPGLVPRLRETRIDNEAQGSDHQPVWVEMAS